MPEPKEKTFLAAPVKGKYECPICGYQTTYHPEDDSGTIWVRMEKNSKVFCLNCVSNWIARNVKPMRRLPVKRSEKS